MAFRFESDDEELAELHEINVTPFIDVMLVLLIIFMIAAPLSTVDLPVNLPRASAAPQEQHEAPLYLTVRGDLALSVGETPAPLTALSAALDAAAQGDKERRVFVRADKTVSYGDLMDVLNAVRAAWRWSRSQAKSHSLGAAVRRRLGMGDRRSRRARSAWAWTCRAHSRAWPRYALGRGDRHSHRDRARAANDSGE